MSAQSARLHGSWHAYFASSATVTHRRGGQPDHPMQEGQALVGSVESFRGMQEMYQAHRSQLQRCCQRLDRCIITTDCAKRRRQTDTEGREGGGGCNNIIITKIYKLKWVVEKRICLSCYTEESLLYVIDMCMHKRFFFFTYDYYYFQHPLSFFHNGVSMLLLTWIHFY